MSAKNASSLESAVAIATDHAAKHAMEINAAAVRETSSGWYFPWLGSGIPEPGSNGIVVNKETGKIFALGSAFSVDRDLRFYDKGYQSNLYDLVVLAVNDADQAVKHLSDIGPTISTPEYESGVVWRIPRRLTADEIRGHLRSLPHVFPDIKLYGRLEVLEEAEEDRSFEFKAVPRVE